MNAEKTRGCFVEESEIARIWPNYFTDVEFSVQDPRSKLILEFSDFFSTQPGQQLVSQVKDDHGIFYLPVDLQWLRKACAVEGFYVALEEAPREALMCMGVAVHKALLSHLKNDQLEDKDKINVRLYNHPSSVIALKNLKAAYIGRLVSVRGTVVKVSTVRPLVVQMNFSCAKCGAVITRIFPDGKFSPPVICILTGCKSRTFTPIRSTARLIDFQKIRVQELLRSENNEEGRVPRTVECELTEDLVDACIPGDVVTVIGIIKVINNYMDVGGGKSKNKNQGLYYLYLEAVSIRNSKSQSLPEDSQVSIADTRVNMLVDLYSFSSRDLEFIVMFSEEHGSDIFRQMLQSICPSIYGHELVKAGITLALFGGVQKHSMDQNKVPVRGDIHVIVVGDPGLGKSQLLQAAAGVSPRGIYVCGNATTNAGLTVAVVKDPLTNDYAFEAGAMVLADSGLCCIDEFDKMSSEHQLHAGSGEDCAPPRKLHKALMDDRDTEFCVKGGSLASRLKLDPRKDRDFVPLPVSLLRKYIAYARSFVSPRMSKSAAEILRKFYLRLRDHNNSADGTPITARQLESLVRLAEARARVDLREEITAQDALDVVEIMKESLYDKYVDEHGVVDFARSGGMSQQKEAKRFLSALHKESELQQKDCFSISEIYSLADKISLRVPDIDMFVDNLNSVGYLLKKGPKTYQVLSSSYSRSQASRSRC